MPRLRKEMFTAGPIKRAKTSVPMDELRAERMADAFRVVADSTRLRILSVIASKDPEESWVGELTEALISREGTDGFARTPQRKGDELHTFTYFAPQDVSSFVPGRGSVVPHTGSL
jgi:hypothetical protein